MKITKTVKFKITTHTDIFQDTLEQYRSALSFFVNLIHEEYHEICLIESSKDQMRKVEQLCNRTKNNQSIRYEYDFSLWFYKFPCYLRRSAINEALGIVSSYYSNLINWHEKKEAAQAKGKQLKIKPTTLQLKHNAFPVFYKGNMFEQLGNGQAKIKIFHNNDWVWQIIQYQTKNLKKRNLDNFKENNPSLVRKGKKYFLHISYEGSCQLNKTAPKKQTVIGVDLGINQSAVCSVMNAEGTIIDRKFINQSIEKDRMQDQLNRLAKANRQSGKCKKPNIWRKINGYQQYIVQDTINEIVKLALKHNTDVIVLEHLGKMKVSRNFYGARRLRAKLQFWAKMRIQKGLTHKAHANGIRISRINPRNTSRLAFDGSGEVNRLSHYEYALFKGGKLYHADLSASYNIGARYLIRTLYKTLSEMNRSVVLAKVPELLGRTTQGLSLSQATMASLIRLNRVITSLGKRTRSSRIHVMEAPSIAA